MISDSPKPEKSLMVIILITIIMMIIWIILLMIIVMSIKQIQKCHTRKKISKQRKLILIKQNLQPLCHRVLAEKAGLLLAAPGVTSY